MQPADRPEPIFNVPAVVLAVLVILAGVHAGRTLLPDAADAQVLATFAFVPGRVTAAFDPAPVVARAVALATPDQAGSDAFLAARFFLGSGSLQPWTALTYALLHGNWTHLGLNAVWLLAFGAPVARRLKPLRFLLLLMASALAGAATHYAVDPLSLQPLVGASASVSGCMGAALRFMFQGPIDTAQDGSVATLPRVPLMGVLRDRRAASFLVVWMVSNLVTGVAAVPLGLADMPIAWQAHVGGFLLGLLAFGLFDPRRAQPPPVTLPPDDLSKTEPPREAS